jgi:hypothetical protein
VSGITQLDSLELDKDDAKTLATALAEVLKYHKIYMTPKQEAYALLMEAAAQVYPPMAFAAFMEFKAKQEAARKNAPPKPVPGQPVNTGPSPPPPPRATKPSPVVVKDNVENVIFPSFDPTKISMPDGSWPK